MLIVLAHCFGESKARYFFELLIVNTVSASTSLFVFISGYFLHRVFYSRNIEYKSFLAKKFVLVGIPYLLMSTIFMFLYWVVTGGVPTHYLLETFSTSQVIVINFFTGRHLTAYWYIPFALIVFSLTPLFYSFIKLKRNYQMLIVIIWFLCSAILFGRPSHTINPFHSLLYFTPFYMLGMMYSVYESSTITMLQRYRFFLGIMWLLSLLGMTLLGHVGNHAKLNPFTFEGVDLLVFQKIILIFFIISFLSYYAKSKIRILSFIADNSFPVFFIHSWVLAICSFAGITSYVVSIERVAIFFVFIFCMSLFIAVLTRKVLGQYSRFLVGR